MADQEHVTLGELYRLCQRIEHHVALTNGRVNDLEGEFESGRVRKLEDDALRIKTVWTLGVLSLGLLADTIRHKLGL
jgi:hypothetical protein